MIALLRVCCCTIMALYMTAAGALAEKRVALVVGNAKYAHASTLANPENDAEDITRTLRALNFDVTTEINLDAKGIERTYTKFANKLRNADVALFYYAGHGMQYDGENYLVPIDAKLTSEAAIARETVPMTKFINLMENHTPISLVFLDACRDNPLATRLFRSLNKTRSLPVSRGLSRIETKNSDTLLVYATAPDHVAADGDGRNSPFTEALLKHIRTPDVEVEVMLKRVTRSVLKKTGARQKPERLSQLTQEFYFKRRPRQKSPTELAKAELERQIREIEQRLADASLNKPTSLSRGTTTEPKLEAHQTTFVPETVAIPAGTFRMGCTSGQTCRGDELPVHLVSLHAFRMAKFETTFAQWDACVADGGCPAITDDEGWGRGNRPVINVTWQDAVTYTNWLSRKTGERWRLPTEAEWEYAARAGTVTRFAFGDQLSSTQANVGNSSGTVPVGHYPPNRFGLHDMHGNVWEWVSDRYRKNYYRTSPKADPKGPVRGAKRVNRGGGWYYKSKFSRSAMRWGQDPATGRSNVGFRVVKEQ